MNTVLILLNRTEVFTAFKTGNGGERLIRGNENATGTQHRAKPDRMIDVFTALCKTRKINRLSSLNHAVMIYSYDGVC